MLACVGSTCLNPFSNVTELLQELRSAWRDEEKLDVWVFWCWTLFAEIFRHQTELVWMFRNNLSSYSDEKYICTLSLQFLQAIKNLFVSLLTWNKLQHLVWETTDCFLLSSPKSNFSQFWTKQEGAGGCWRLAASSWSPCSRLPHRQQNESRKVPKMLHHEWNWCTQCLLSGGFSLFYLKLQWFILFLIEPVINQ